MNFYFFFAAWFVVVPSTIAIIKIKKIPKKLYFLIFAIWTSLFFEILSHYFTVKYHNNLIPYNLIILIFHLKKDLLDFILH
jgi:hypothetical protein